MNNSVSDFTTTVFTDSASDAMQVLGVGELPTPAACIVCGNGTYAEGYLFFGIHIDFLGAVLLCGTCLLQAGEKFGLMSPIIAKQLHNQAVELAEEAARLRLEVEAQRVRLAVFDDALRNIVPDPITDGDGASVADDTLSTLSELPLEATQPDSATGTTESVESIASEGLSESATTPVHDITAEPRRPVKSSGPNL